MRKYFGHLIDVLQQIVTADFVNSIDFDVLVEMLRTDIDIHVEILWNMLIMQRDFTD